MRFEWIIAALLGQPSAPAEPSRVTIVSSSDEDPLLATLQGELGSLGFETDVELSDRDDVTWRELRDVVEREHVAAAIWVSPDHGEVVIWVDDRGKGRAIVRALPTQPGQDSDDVVVLRAVELLRASLRETDADEVQTAERTPEPPIEPDPPPRPESPLSPASPPTSPRWVLDLGPAISGAPGGVGVAAHVAGGLRFMIRPRVGVRLGALAPTVGPRVEADEGSARVLVAHIEAGPHFGLRAPDKRVQPDLGVGVGLSIVRLDGSADAPFVGTTDHVFGFVGRVGAGVAFLVHRNVAIRLDAGVGLTGPTPRVAFGDRTVARWGQPFGRGGIALEARFGSTP